MAKKFLKDLCRILDHDWPQDSWVSSTDTNGNVTVTADPLYCNRCKIEKPAMVVTHNSGYEIRFGRNFR